MAKSKLLKLLDALAPEVQLAFYTMMAQIRDDVDLRDLIRAIEMGDVEAALAAFNLGREYVRPLEAALLGAYAAGGDLMVDDIRRMARAQGARVSMRFDVRNLRAERFTAEQSSRLVTEVLETTKDDLRRVLTMGMQSGTAPRTAALDIVGRSPSPGRPRRGGIIGLHTRQIEQSERVIAILSDPERISEYFIKDRVTGKLKPRFKGTDRRYDAKVRAAIREGRALDRADMRALTNLHRNRMLRDRGETIAETELLASLSHAQDEGLRQLVDRGEVQSDDIEGEWDSSEDSATRDSHRAANGQRRKLGQPFDVGGYQMLAPGDTSLGAPAKEVIKCRCHKRIRINFVAGLNRGD